MNPALDLSDPVARIRAAIAAMRRDLDAGVLSPERLIHHSERVLDAADELDAAPAVDALPPLSVRFYGHLSVIDGDLA